MGIKFHLDSAELMSCASGTQPEALGAVISTHLSMCPHCRNELKIHSFIGETLFNTLDETPLEFIKTTQPPKQNISQSSINFPSQKLHEVLHQVNSRQFNKIQWKPVASGVEDFSFSLSGKDNGTLKLIKLGNNISIPHLERSGLQIIMVMDGALVDKDGIKNKGDIIHLGPENPYSLTASDVNGCICLIGSETSVDLHKVIS
jgi:putative transcriptional regulator